MCRTANGWDINGFGQLKDGRGNICPCTIILPTIAMEARVDIESDVVRIVGVENEIVEHFMDILDKAPAVPVETVDRGFEQPDPAIIAVDTHIFRKSVHISENVAVTPGGKQFQFRGFVKRDIRAVIAEDKGDRFSVIAVGGIPYQSGPGES